MTARIIDNKKIDLTESEYGLYAEICKSYDGPHMQGTDLFQGLFETNDQGIIVFLRPPTSRYSSMEVYMFLVGVMVHQHVGSACDNVDSLYKEMSAKMAELDKKIAEADELITRFKPVETAGN